MAAIFITSKANDVFMKNVKFKAPFASTELEGIWSNDKYFTLVTDVSVQTSEILQHFTGFDDIITTLHFGKSVGGITIGGIMFSNCESDMPGVNNFYNIVGKYRGKTVRVSLGNHAFDGVVAETSVQLTSNPDTMAYFTIRMNMVGHSLN